MTARDNTHRADKSQKEPSPRNDRAFKVSTADPCSDARSKSFLFILSVRLAERSFEEVFNIKFQNSSRYSNNFLSKRPSVSRAPAYQDRISNRRDTFSYTKQKNFAAPPLRTGRALVSNPSEWQGPANQLCTPDVNGTAAHVQESS